jgi:hypothetical protein
MSNSKSGEQSRGKYSGQKLSKTDAERRAFHRQQLQNPDILIPDLDPDKPVLLGELQRFDELICTRLRMLGYPGTGSPDGPPQSCRPMVLARKLAGGSQDLSKAEISVLADRIGWLQRNYFRWGVRNGYAEYFASRGANSPSENTDKIIKVAASDTAPPERRNASNEGYESDPKAQTTPSDDVFTSIRKLGEQASVDPPRSVSQRLGSDADDASDFTSHRAAGDLASAESSGGSEWSIWATEIVRRQPKQVPQMPQRPRTFGKEFPIPKAKALLVAVALQKTVSEQIRLARDLLEDRDELYQALKHGDQAREDLLNIFACLGLEL